MLAPKTVAVSSAYALAVIAVAVPSSSRADASDVYKCAGEGGIPVYQEMPCAAGRELRNFQLDPPEITIIPAPSRPGAAAAPAPREPKAPNDAKSGNGAKGGNGVRNGKPPQPADASERKNVRLGMTEAEVLAKLGHPDVTVGSRNSASMRWTYMPAPGDADTTTALVMTKGVVTDIERKVLRK